MNLDIKKAATIAALLTVAMFLVNWGAGALLGAQVQTLFATVNLPGVGSVDLPNAVSPISGTVGGKVLGWLQGVIPGLDITVLITLFISSLVTLLIGGFLVDQFNLPAFKGTVGKLASVIIWGAVPLYLLFVGLVVPSISVFIGLFVYTFVAALATAFVADMMNVKI